MIQSTCDECGATKPVRSFYLVDGMPGAECRSCVQIRAKGLRPAGETKYCTGCNQDLRPDRFYRQQAHYTGLSFYCRDCSAAATARRRNGDPDYAAKRRAYYAANREQLAGYARERYRKNPVQRKLAAWRSQGIDITEDRYHEMHGEQGGRCAICTKSEAGNGKALAVDHDHATGRVRGLLCDDCNLALGRFQDSPDVLRRAIDYLSA